jgi:hypothetical protein
MADLPSNPGASADMPSPDDTARESRLAGIFSTGRSGSTWLGAIVASHPDVAYRFEPKPGRRGRAAATEAAASRLVDPDVGMSDLAEIEAGLRLSDPCSDKPPFTPRRRGALPFPFLRGPMWAACRRFPALSPVHRLLYTPRGRPLVVFKHVAQERACRRLLERTAVPIVYLVRHPCATISSILKGQRDGIMPNGRASVIERFVADNAPHLQRRFGTRIPSMGPHQHEALLWRWSVETSLAPALDATPPTLLLVHYENLCRNPAGETAKVLAHLGLAADPQVDAFVAASTDPAARGLREPGIRRYFSVFRNPLDSMDKWRRDLDDSTRREILEIVEESPVFQRGVAEADWWTETPAVPRRRAA